VFRPSRTRIDLMLLDPFIQGLRHAADVGGNRFDTGPQGGILASMLLHHPNGTLSHFGEKRLDLLLFMAPSSQS
jgi:hypothetical protein